MLITPSSKPLLRRRFKRLIILAAAFLLLLFSALSAWQTTSYAVTPKLEQIRVALFLDSGRSFRNTVPFVTLSSQLGLTIGLRQPAGVKTWLAVDPSKPVRFGVDQYRVFLMETDNYDFARSVYASFANTAYSPSLLRRDKLGKVWYQVYIGSFSDKEEAQAVKDKVIAQNKGAWDVSAARLAGPLYLNAGTYKSEEEALRQQTALAQKGIDADLVCHENGSGQPVYSVWVGEAADSAQLDALKTRIVRTVPNLALLPIDPNLPYLLRSDDLSTGNSADDSTAYYRFNRESQKVWIESKDQRIQINEKNERIYRGSVEIIEYNGSLAVVNELPFEQYLVAVVAAEMAQGWPLEAMKAQAVAARTYALRQGMKYQIAHISDSTIDQAYYGVKTESDDVAAAVDATKGEVLTDAGGLITPFYFSNAGGMTADSEEVWGQTIAYLKNVPSPDDIAQKGKPLWHRVVFDDGQAGYIRSDLVQESGEKNGAGLPYLKANGSEINVRAMPFVNNSSNPPIRKIGSAERFVSFEQTPESNAYSWIRGPYPADSLLKRINAALPAPLSGELRTLEVSKRGASGRASELKANGQPLQVSRPDTYRSMLDGLPSLRFEIEETARYTMMGANGAMSSRPEQAGPLYVLSAGSASPRPIGSSSLFIMGADQNVRMATDNPSFRFHGFGYGHGLGMSQWGAKGLAELGYDYKRILQYYYQGVNVTKE